jgi:hypothetical protein
LQKIVPYASADIHMSEIGKIKDIAITNLILDLENYRLGPQPGQNETILSMIEEQGEKLVTLAEDIVENGLSPFDLMMVCPTDDKGLYRVIEGNRRITALKLLHQPALAHGTSLEKTIREIVGKRDGKSINKCRCVIVENKQAAYLWIERKHDIGLEGAGTERWGAMAIRRAQAAQGKPQIALQVVDYVSKHAQLSEKERKEIADPDFPITNLERILEDKDSMVQLCLRVQDEEIVAINSAEWTLGMLTQIVKDIGSKAKKVGDIFNKAKRDNYINDVGKQQSASPTRGKPWSLASGASIKSGPGTHKAATGKRLPLSTERKTIIPRGYRLPIPPARINKIYDELRKLRVDDLENGGAVLLRVFIELSVDDYIKRNAGVANANDKLYVKLQKTAAFLEANSILTKNQLKPIRDAINRPNNVLSTETLNAYVHNPLIMPKADDLKRSWDSIEPFVAKLWK